MAAENNTRSSRRKPKLQFGSRTDIGCVREHNEDSLIVSPPLFAVADGMGGHAAGEVASEIAVKVVEERAPIHPDADALGKSVEAANIAVIQAPFKNIGREGMGTTMTAAILEGERLVIAQVGDSRAYLLHQGALQQLTRDHSLMADMIDSGKITEEEAKTHPNRSVITRAIGSDPHMVPDLYEIDVEAGDRLMLCSDGLYGEVDDDEIQSTLCRTQDPQRCASQLVNKAIAEGGHDNVTVIVVDVEGFRERQAKREVRKSRAWLFVIIALLVAIFAGAVFGLNTYINSSAYLIEEDGKVCVYSGVPDSIFGLEFKNLVQTTDIKVEDLQPGVASRLADGLRVDSIEAAENLLDDYRSEAEEKQAERAKDQAQQKKAQTAVTATTGATDQSTGGGA